MAKYKPPAEADVFGMFATAPTKREATEKAKEELTRLTNAISLPPVLITHGGVTALVWRAKTCWTSLIISGTPHAIVRGELNQQMFQDSSVSRLTQVMSTICHVVTIAWHHGVSDDKEWVWDGIDQNKLRDMSFGQIEDMRRRCMHQIRFQRAYKAHRDAGYSDKDAHAKASGYACSLEHEDARNEAVAA